MKRFLVGVLLLLNGEEFAIGLNKFGEYGFGDDDKGDVFEDALEYGTGDVPQLEDGLGKFVRKLGLCCALAGLFSG